MTLPTCIPGVVVHPVLDDVGVQVRLPCGSVSGYTVMSLVPVDEYLQSCDTTLLAHLAEMLQLLHRGVFLDYDNPLLDWGAENIFIFIPKPANSSIHIRLTNQIIQLIQLYGNRFYVITYLFKVTIKTKSRICLL